MRKGLWVLLHPIFWQSPLLVPVVYQSPVTMGSPIACVILEYLQKIQGERIIYIYILCNNKLVEFWSTLNDKRLLVNFVGGEGGPRIF